MNNFLHQTVEDQELYRSPQVNPARAYLSEHFDDEPAFKKRWVKSEAKKQGVDETIAKYDGKWEVCLTEFALLCFADRLIYFGVWIVKIILFQQKVQILNDTKCKVLTFCTFCLTTCISKIKAI